MARNIKGFPAEGAGAAIAEPEAAKSNKKWVPVQFRDDGTVDSSKLEPATYTEKVRPLRLADGTTVHQKQMIFVKTGAPQYRVTDKGELIAVYRKRGGIGTKLVFQFKMQYKNDDKGRVRKARDVAFRKTLKAHGIPGA